MADRNSLASLVTPIFLDYRRETAICQILIWKCQLLNRDSAHLLILTYGTICLYLQEVSSSVISRTPAPEAIVPLTIS
jgi:hypothetical protein